MKKLLLIAAFVAGSIPLMATESEAVVCARGVYRAGCAGPNGAVGVRRGPVYGGAAVVRRPYGGRAVYRRW
jgi:hypothetical protein